MWLDGGFGISYIEEDLTEEEAVLRLTEFVTISVEYILNGAKRSRTRLFRTPFLEIATAEGNHEVYRMGGRLVDPTAVCG